MATSSFLSFTGADKALADRMAEVLASRDIAVIRYDPFKPWDDPVERMAIAIAQEVECVVCLRLEKPELTQWMAEEVSWAEELKIPVLYVDREADFERVAEQVARQEPPEVEWETSNELFNRIGKHWGYQDGELGPTEAAAVARGADEGGSAALDFFLFLALTGLAVVAAVASFVAAFCVTKYLLVLTAASGAVAFWANRRMTAVGTQEPGYSEIIKRRRAHKAKNRASA